MRRPLGFAALIFSCGIFFCEKAGLSAFWSCLAVAVFFISLIAAEKNRAFLLCFSPWLFFAGAFALGNSFLLPSCHISRLIPSFSTEEYIVKGYVSDTGLYGRAGASFVLRSSHLCRERMRQECCGDILVLLKESKGFVYGEELTVRGRMGSPFLPDGASGRTFRDHLYRQGICVIMRADLSGVNRIGCGRKGFALKAAALRLKEETEKVIFKYMDGLPAVILDAMLLGERRLIPRQLYDSMVKTGTLHILVVSGFNVGVVGFFVMSLLKLMRVKRNPRIFIVSAALVFYCLMSGASNPVVRATLMAEVFLFSRFFRREPDIYNSLGAAALLILIFSPRQLFDSGFQLSFASVLSIVWLYPKLTRFFRLNSARAKLSRRALEGFLVSLSAWLGTSFLLLAYSRVFSWVTVIANFFIVPLAGLITLCGFGLAIVGSLSPPLAPYFACVLQALTALLLKVNGFLAALPFSHTTIPWAADMKY